MNHHIADVKYARQRLQHSQLQLQPQSLARTRSCSSLPNPASTNDRMQGDIASCAASSMFSSPTTDINIIPVVPVKSQETGTHTGTNSSTDKTSYGRRADHKIISVRKLLQQSGRVQQTSLKKQHLPNQQLEIDENHTMNGHSTDMLSLDSMGRISVLEAEVLQLRMQLHSSSEEISLLQGKLMGYTSHTCVAVNNTVSPLATVQEYIPNSMSNGLSPHSSHIDASDKQLDVLNGVHGVGIIDPIIQANLEPNISTQLKDTQKRLLDMEGRILELSQGKSILQQENSNLSRQIQEMTNNNALAATNPLPSKDSSNGEKPESPLYSAAIQETNHYSQDDAVSPSKTKLSQDKTDSLIRDVLHTISEVSTVCADSSHNATGIRSEKLKELGLRFSTFSDYHKQLLIVLDSTTGQLQSQVKANAEIKRLVVQSSIADVKVHKRILWLQRIVGERLVPKKQTIRCTSLNVLSIPSCFGGHEHGSAVGTMILAKVPNFTPECLWIVGSVYVGHSGATTNYSRREAFASIRQALDRVVPFDNNHPVLIFGDWNTDPQRLQRIVHSWGHARALLTSPRVDRQTAVADHFVIRTSIRAEAQGQPPVPRAPTISRHHCLEATDRIATSNYWDVLADANAVADNLSLRLSPPATRSNRRLLSGTTKRAILASNTARQAFIAAATNPTLTQSSATLYEMSGLDSRLLPPNSREWMVANNGSSTLTISTALYQTVEPISYSAAARAMSGNSSRSAAVTPLYNSDGIVQYDPTSILRVMQGHYGSLAADTTGHSLDLQYWHDRQPIQVLSNTPTIRNSDILDQDFSWNQIAAALLQMSPRKAPGDDGITTAFYQAALYIILA
ncbi:hypothetical protein BASA62_006518 [Batrachochytrium salamandrivorans]|nr:hypothetical protein BASA62_006518 [Batrachochytrium salamandrivorans]